MKKALKVFFGFALVAAGIIWILCTLGVVTVNIFFPGWWTLIIIVPCLFNLFTGHDRSGSMFGILLGVVMLLCAQDILCWGDFWKYALAGLLICIGVKLVFDRSLVFETEGNPQAKRELRSITRDGKNIRCYEVQFGKEFLNFDGQIFEGLDVKAGFGAVRIDLRKAHIQPDAVIRLDCSFCGVEIFVPEGIVVKIASDATFGAISDERRFKPSEGAATLFIDGSVSFGGVDIK